jgi:hypothetical protein
MYETSEDKALTPSGMEGIAEGIRSLVAESTASPETKKEVGAEGEKEPCVTCEEKAKAGEPEAPKSRFFIIDKETGQEVPAVFKSEGKVHVPDSVDKILTWTGMGIHANRRLEQVKGYEEFVKMLIQAKQDGRLIIKDEKSSSPSRGEKVEDKESEDDEIITDPVVLAERKKRQLLEGQIKELTKTVDSLKAFVINTKTSEMKQQIETEMDKFSKSYPLGKKRSNQVWKLLAEVSEDGSPTYDVETAMKKVHEESLKEFKEWIKEHPEFVEKDKIKTEGVQEYLKEKEEKEAAPVSSPSGAPAAVSKGKAGEEIKSMADAVGKIKDLLKSSSEAGKKA